MTEKDTMRRVVLLLEAKPGAERLENFTALSAVAAGVETRARGQGLEVRFGCQIPEDPLALAAEGIGRSMTPVSALLQISGSSRTSPETLIDLVDGVARSLRRGFDLGRSAAAVGAVRQITTGPSRPVVLVVGTRKLATLSEAEFHSYWAETHAPLALSMMPPGAPEKIGYEQLHAEGEGSRRAAAAAGVGVGDLAGVLQVFCREPGDFLRFAAEPRFAARIYEDEKSFADQTLMRGGFIAL